MTTEQRGVTSPLSTARRGPAFWLHAARAPFFTGSLAPVLVGTATAFYETGSVFWLYAILALLAIVLLHAGANLTNDYYDHLSGNDAINVNRATPFTGGSRLIQRGIVQPRDILSAALVSLAAGCAIGGYLAWATGWPLLVLGTIGASTGFFYTAAPLKLGYRGLGELVVFLDFGVLPVLGAHYIHAHAFSYPSVIAGIAVGLLMTNVLWINQFQDAQADAAVGKRHWVVRLGRKRAARVHAALFALSYFAMLFGVQTSVLPTWSALGLLPIPLALWASLISSMRYDDLERLRPANTLTIATHGASSGLLAVGLILARII